MSAAAESKPVEWQTVPLGEVADIKLGKMLDRAKHTSGRRLPYLRNVNVRWGAIEIDDLLEMYFKDDQVERFGLKENDILVYEGGEPGRAAVWRGGPTELKFQKALHRVRFRVPFEPRLLVYLLELQAKSGGLERRFTGSTIKHFTREAFLQLPVPMLPLADQQRIVAEIEKQFTRLDAAVAALKQVKANLKRYRAAVLKATFPTAHLPNGWTWSTPTELARREPNAICAGPFGTIFKAKDFRQTGMPIIFLRHVAPGKYLTSKPGFMDEAKWRDLFKPYSVFGGELLITKLGEPPGTCAIYPEGIGAAMVTPDVIKMTVNSDIIIPRFLMHYFNSEGARRFGAASAFGTTRLRLTIPMFRQMPIPLPPLAEQHRIVAEVERRLSVVDELETVVEANLQRAKRLRQSILQRAFSGKL